MEEKFRLKDPKGDTLVPLDSILFFKADNGYTEVHLEDGRIIVQSGPLVRFVERLRRSNLFCHVHKSYAVNVNKVIRIESCRQLILENGTEIPMSEEGRAILEDMLPLF